MIRRLVVCVSVCTGKYNCTDCTGMYVCHVVFYLSRILLSDTDLLHTGTVMPPSALGVCCSAHTSKVLRSYTFICEDKFLKTSTFYFSCHSLTCLISSFGVLKRPRQRGQRFPSRPTEKCKAPNHKNNTNECMCR